MTLANLSIALMGLNADLQTALEKLGYNKPTEIQLQSIPIVIAGHGLIGIAATKCVSERVTLEGGNSR